MLLPKINPKVYIYLGGAIIAIALLWYIKKKADEKAVAKLASGELSTPSWVQDQNQLSAEQKWQIIEAIREATKGLGTDENSLYNALRMMKTKTNFNIINDVYRTKYGENIIDLLDSELSSSEMTKANDILNSLK